MITFIIPVWNSIDYLPQAIDSILAQTDPDWRLLVSDNCSNDGTRVFLKNLMQKSDPRIRIFLQETNLGIFGNLNFLVENVSTDLIQILCADDSMSTPESLASILDFWNSAGSQIGAVRWDGANLMNYGIPTQIQSEYSQLYFFLFGNLMGNLSCVSCRTSYLKSAGQFDQKYPFVGDFDFWSRMAQIGDIVVSSHVLVKIRQHSGQASNYLNKNGEMYIELSSVTSSIFNRLPLLGFKSLLLLKVAGSLVYDCQFRLSAIRAFIFHGNRRFLSNLDKASRQSSYALPRFILYILTFFSIGGRVGKRTILFSALRALKTPFSYLDESN